LSVQAILLQDVWFRHKSQQRVEESANESIFETDNQACTGRVTFYYLLTLGTLISQAWVDWVWVRS